MPWTIRTSQPGTTGMNYLSTVVRPAGFKPKSLPLIAKKTGPSTYELEYVADPIAKAASDVWDTGIKYTNKTPRIVDIDAMAGGGSKGKDRPTVLDGL